MLEMTVFGFTIRGLFFPMALSSLSQNYSTIRIHVPNGFIIEIEDDSGSFKIETLIARVAAFMMFAVNPDRAFLATGSTDMRKSINGLSILVERALDLFWNIHMQHGYKK